MATEQLALAHGTKAPGRTRTIWVAGLLVLVALFVVFDMIEDTKAGDLTGFHIATEIGIVALCIVTVVVLLRGLSLAEASAEQLGHDLAAARAEAARFREEAGQALSRLSTAIDHQFDRWSLTQAEREVALLILKGLSHREAAEARSTNEATVRQQALSVYRKSGLRSRSELSAFFLQDLLLPRQGQAPLDRPGSADAARRDSD